MSDALTSAVTKKLSEIVSEIPTAALKGEDREIEGLVPPGEGSETVAEVWRQGVVQTSNPVLVDAGLEIENSGPQVVVEELEDYLPELLSLFEPQHSFEGIFDGAYIADDFSFEDSVYVGPGAYVGPGVRAGDGVTIESDVYIRGDVSLGANVHLFSGVKIQSPAEIGENAIIHSNTVIGADGYGYIQRDDKHVKIPQIGRVIVEENVEIGANSTIDRATLGATVVGVGTKIDDQVHVAHNCKIGQGCLIIGKSGLAGSVTLGDGVVVGGSTSIKDHVEIADNVMIAGRSGVTKDVEEEGKIISGFPARDHRSELKAQALSRKLPDIYSRIKKLEKKLENK